MNSTELPLLLKQNGSLSEVPTVGFCGLRSSLVGAQGYQKFPLSKPGAGQSIALHAVPADMMGTFADLVSAFPMHSSLFFPKLLQSIQKQWNVS